MYNKTTIRERFSYFRNQKGLSQTELGLKLEEIMGEPFDRFTISNYETGRRRIPAYLVPALAQIFGITTDELFYTERDIASLQNIDTLGVKVAGYREMMDSQPEAAAQKSLEALEQARKEIQGLKEELRLRDQKMAIMEEQLQTYDSAAQKMSKMLGIRQQKQS
ncbi:hypothetical protein GCM10009122_55570 [Fulvivirga kasyanovii]|uniref:helix-turn-helix domain-containing protein n=1 Tax=Fulvivirga kasyanovii TaxID=396812 RepID=UPI0012BD2859